MNIQTIKHVSDCVPLYLPHSLYLKPNARFNISVSLPPTVTGKSISSFDAMENLRKMIAPDKFSVLKVRLHISHHYLEDIDRDSWGSLCISGDEKHVGGDSVRC